MKKILVIEDNAENMYMMRFLLEKKGFAVIEARTGEEGVKLALAHRPDLILMDIQLPGMDGYETTEKIRESEIDGKIPIVAVTSFAMTGDREKALKAGCNGYVEKPIDPDTFIETIEAFL